MGSKAVKLYLVLFFLISSNTIISQSHFKHDYPAQLNEQRLLLSNSGTNSNNQSNNHFFDDVFGTLGLGLGPEYLFGLKGSLIKPFSLIGKKERKNILINNKLIEYSGFYPVGVYLSVDPSLFLFVGVWGGIGVNAGITLPFITIDNSLTVHGVVGYAPGSGNWNYTYNPKIGTYIGPVWFKIGPSFTIKEKEDKGIDFLQIKGEEINFELTFKLKF